MKNIFILVTFLCALALSLQAQNKNQVKRFVLYQVNKYPKIHLTDIYKSCYQDYLGSEHLISSKDVSKQYISKELDNLNKNRTAQNFEKCGLKGNYIRVDLQVINEGLLDIDTLNNWFVESSKMSPHTFQEWVIYWDKIVTIIKSMDLNLPDFEKEQLFIDNLLKNNQYACSHSQEYKAHYDPHYRIISKKILKKKEIKTTNVR